MNIRLTVLAAVAAAITMATPVLAEDSASDAVDYIHNVAQDADQCVFIADSLGYSDAIDTDVCQRFAVHGNKATDVLTGEILDDLQENDPELLFQLRDDFTTIREGAKRMEYLANQ